MGWDISLASCSGYNRDTFIIFSPIAYHPVEHYDETLQLKPEYHP